MEINLELLRKHLHLLDIQRLEGTAGGQAFHITAAVAEEGSGTLQGHKPCAQKQTKPPTCVHGATRKGSGCHGKGKLTDARGRSRKPLSPFKWAGAPSHHCTPTS